MSSAGVLVTTKDEEETEEEETEEEEDEEGAGTVALGTLPKGFEALNIGSLLRVEEEEGAECFRDAAYASAVAEVASCTIASSIINRAVVGESDTL